MQRTSGFVTGSLWPGFTVPPLHPPGLHRHLTHDLTASHVLSHLLSFGPSSFWLCFISRRLELLRPLLTSRSSVALSPFQAQGEISPGKNALLHRTTAEFTPPKPWSQKLCGFMPARLARQRRLSGSCTSARNLRSTLPSHIRSPLCSCASLRSL